MAEPSTIGIIGAGNMATAMIDGWKRAEPARAGRLLVTDRSSGRAARLAERHGVEHVESNADLVARSEIVVISVKPIDVEHVLRDVSHLVTPAKSVCSVAADA